MHSITNLSCCYDLLRCLPLRWVHGTPVAQLTQSKNNNVNCSVPFQATMLGNQPILEALLKLPEVIERYPFFSVVTCVGEKLAFSACRNPLRRRLRKENILCSPRPGSMGSLLNDESDRQNRIRK